MLLTSSFPVTDEALENDVELRWEALLLIPG